MSTNTFVADINALADFIKQEGLADKTYRGKLPKSYDNNSASVRLLSANNSHLNGHYYQQLRDYQVVLFNEDSTKVLANVDVLMRKLTESLKLEVDGGFLQLMDGIGASEVFLTEDGKTYASIIVINGRVSRQRPLEDGIKVQEVGINIVERNDL